ncbi:outer membrane lipid asymmetry maintenance protein MlaD [Providencia alcalifaciens]|uniref:outer membrane lipid asymmetry maintenance protein MlaD n=1 Tax=Providencia alcalifaciens TaxID=126385 RepID=UPI001CC6C4F8|nr:outer membrane lipid asymmetry maintenance protein MlaD [Providencia alcalifaciens]CAG9427459.1 Intermembrane phospholipid transport system binding protein MlaD [Providencia alcalifaciens]CAG9431197.1 Intermembrane phospholipid transport system binding protein MlaD [Providencia alcalifaciens]CAG9431384.1 Intermembrane phospholipid transport system binding protein MlaD [Providencia alcalifaciens]CAG9432373.1 Intermembrane phospholipid transport system binding protein MlaD [Providencia alcalif
MQSKKSEIWVGCFMLLAIAAIVFLCLKVADLQSIGSQSTYRVSASFENVGGLKVGSPIKVGGVVVGRVAGISLDKKNYVPDVQIDLLSEYDNIPDSSSLSIRTSGLLGEQYIAMNIGPYDEDMGISMLKEGGRLEDTKPAMVLEDLIGQFLYKSGDSQGVSAPEAPATAPASAPAQHVAAPAEPAAH